MLGGLLMPGNSLHFLGQFSPLCLLAGTGSGTALFAAAAGEQSNRGSSPSWAKLIVLEGELAFLENC